MYSNAWGRAGVSWRRVAIGRVGIVLLGLASAGTHATVRVAPTGVATYTVPLAVTPAAGSLDARVKLNYSNRAATGLLGIGWSLEGLSSIARCPRTAAFDGTAGVVANDWNDRYCLEGQRLHLVARAYGEHGAEYRVDADAFAQLRSFGQLGSGPAYFVAKTKSGLELHYGSTELQIDAGTTRLRPDGALVIPRGTPGGGTALSWQLALVRDPLGNTMSFEYETEVTTNETGEASLEHRLKRVHYVTTSRASQPGAAFIEFEYERSPVAADVLRARSGSVALQSTRRLVALRSVSRGPGAAGGVLAVKLLFAYDTRGAQGRSRLVGVHECATDCVLPTRVEARGHSSAPPIVQALRSRLATTPSATSSRKGIATAWTESGSPSAVVPKGTQAAGAPRMFAIAVQSA